MEKFSAYRDPGTGIQPFLTPIPANPQPFVLQVVQPLIYAFAVVRCAVGLMVLAEYFLLLALTQILYPIPPLHRFFSWLFTAINARMLLAIGGYTRIPVEVVSKKKTRSSQQNEKWVPKAGDLIVSNWCSWAELLWLAFRFNPIFVLPVAPAPLVNEPDSNAPGRRTGTGSAAINLNKNGTMQRTPITGFHKVSLVKMLCSLGQTPSTYGLPLDGAVSLEEIRKKADRPVVVFPECTTSNGRGLLRFAEIFDPATPIPVKQFNVFIMCARYDSPTHWNPTATRSIPSPVPLPEPLVQLFTIPFEPSPLSIRLLPLSESPSSGSFLSSDIFSAGGVRDTLTEACSVLISQLGKIKRTNQGWEEKTSFLGFFYSTK
ncbi:hypothetical protein CPB86DRAFT_375744 [Serendipita vermifera]|nr:hypothetical protein CPB86DRAFT_375744 [Serendipita vermifera]